MATLTEHEKFLERAIQLAEESAKSGKGGPFGAVIVKDGKIIAEASNTVTTSKDPTAHAEVNAIRKACAKLNDFELKDCIIYASAEPCPMCFGAIYWARPKAIYFAADKDIAANAGFDDSFIYQEIALSKDKRKITTHHLPLENATQPFKIWVEKKDKIEY